MGMKLSEAIAALTAAQRKLGDVDVTFVRDDQFCDVLEILAVTEPSRHTAWCWSGPVVVLALDPN